MFSLSFLAAMAVALMLASAAQASAFLYTIAGDGSGCAAIGTWDASTKTCTLNRDLNVVGGGGINITGDDVTLEGPGIPWRAPLMEPALI